MKEIYLIRHGETDFNRQGVVQGSGVDSDLNETGRKQARSFFNHYRHLPFDKIYISALKRTRQSVDDFIREGIPFEVIPELNEIGWGDFEGKLQTPEMMKEYQGIIDSWRTGALHRAGKNAETPLAMMKRQKVALQKILKNESEKRILISTHGRYLRAFLCLLSNTPLHLMDDFEHSNLCLYIIHYRHNKFEIAAANITDHLT